MTNSTLTPADALIAALHEPGREHLLDLVRNPLRLTLLCMTWDGSSLPETQAELYERYLRKIYEWNRNLHELEKYAERCGTTTTKLKQNLNRQLGELAKAALNLPQERFRLSQALVEKYLGEELDKTSLGYLALRLGWLNRVGKDGRGDGIFAFYHATFQEYFAALAVEDWDYFLPKDHCDRPVAGKQYRIFEKQWKQVILLWLGREDLEANDKLKFVSNLAAFNDGCRNLYRVKSFFLATEGISQLKDVDMPIPYKQYDQYLLTSILIERTIGVALWDFDVEPKRWSIYNACLQQDAREILKRTTRTKVIAILEQKLYSISVFYSMNYAFKGKTQSEIEAELKKICPDTVMADLAANNMRCLKEMSIYLENLHGYEGAGQIFLDFIEFLWELETQNKLIISSLSSLIETTENLGTRRDAINRLEIIDPHHPAFVQALIKTLATDPDPERRNRAAQILGIINPGDPLVVNWLLDILKANQHQENYRSQIAYHLGLVDPGNTQAQTVLLEIVETTQNEDIRWYLANCLEKYEPGNSGAIAVLLKIIETANHEGIIYEALNTLRSIGIQNNHYDAIMNVVLKIIESTDNGDIIDEAMWWLENLYKINSDATMKTFLKIIETTDNEDILDNVLWSLDHIGKKHNTAVISVLFKILEIIRNENLIDILCYKLLDDIDPEKRDLVIYSFCQIIKSGKLSFGVPYYLHKIDPENPHVIPALVRVIETTDNEDTRCQAARYLQEIDPGNPHVIPALIRVIETTDNDDACCQAARNLQKIDPGNPHVIPALVRVIETTDNEHTAGIAIGTFSIFECNHPEAISVLSKLIQSINNTQLLETAALSLGTIDPGNTQAIITLIKINEINGSSFLPYRIRDFMKSWEGNNQAIAGLLGILETADDSKTLTFVSKMLEEVGKGNYLAISGLMKILQTNTNQKICGYAAYSLAKIDPKNYLVIPELLKALETNQEEDIQWQLALQLGKVDPSNQRATEYLVGIIGANDSQDILKEINWHLKEVEWGSHFGISVIVKLLKISRDKPYEESPISHIPFAQTFNGICHGSTLATLRLSELIQSDYLEGDYSLYFEYLKRTIANREQKEMIISALHSHLSDETYRDNFNLYLECYKLFWYCAENLPYPEFYQAWHNPPTTPHPEAEDNTPATPTPFTQQCNLALLPQILNQANQSLPLHCQPICIDGSRFSDPSNPALQIYTALKKAGCPASPDGKPRTIAELQAYCEDDLSEHQIALILYEEPTDPPPQGFDIAVLNQLARFSHPPIAVVLPQPLPECRLPQFLESDPDLIANILQWLQNLDR